MHQSTRQPGRPITISNRKRLIIRTPGGEEIRIIADTDGGHFAPRMEAPEGTEIRYEKVKALVDEPPVPPGIKVNPLAQ